MYKREGLNQSRKKPDWKKQIKAMKAVIEGKEVKVRKKRAKETKPRNQVEAGFRKDVFKWLKKYADDYKRIENSLHGKHSRALPDFLFFKNNVFYFLELKGTGDLNDEQRTFKERCLKSGINHITAWSVDDIEEGINVQTNP